MNYEQTAARAGSACAPATDGQNIRIRICALSGNGAAKDCFEVFNDWASANNAAVAMRTGSMGYYDLEPVVIVEKSGAPAILYPNMTGETALKLVALYLDGNDPMSALALGVHAGEEYKGIPSLRERPLFKLQRRIALRRCGFVDPESLDQYIAEYNGYSGLDKALRLSPGEAADIIGQAGLCERDGGGRAAHALWKKRSAAEDGEAVVICNAVDCVPEARASRLLLEGDPHAVLEGLLIVAYSIGAPKAILAVPAGNAAMRQLLDCALSQMKEYGLIGTGILESGFSCDIEVRDVPAVPTAWEASALVRFLEGRQAIPYLQATDEIPALDGIPALVSDAETLASAAVVLREGPDDAVGTKIVTLTGDVAHTYTMEVPLDTPIGTLVREIGGLSDIKAVRSGPAGSYIGTDVLDQTVGQVIPGDCGAAVCPELLAADKGDACAVETAATVMQRLHGMSCGKCVFCREGTLHLTGLLDNLIKGEGRPGDLELMEELGRDMKTGCICALGRAAADTILSSLRLFRAEFEHHFKHKQCPAGVKGGAGNGER